MEKTNQELYDKIEEQFTNSASAFNTINHKVLSVKESVEKTLSETNVSIRLLGSMNSKLENIERKINSMDSKINALQQKVD